MSTRVHLRNVREGGRFWKKLGETFTADTVMLVSDCGQSLGKMGVGMSEAWSSEVEEVVKSIVDAEDAGLVA